MLTRPLRIVLAFFPSGDEPVERAFKSLQRLAKVCVVRADNDMADLCRRYAQLRLEGESLLVAEVESGKVEDVVAGIRLAGSPAIFVVRPDFTSEFQFSDAVNNKEARPPDSTPLTRRAILQRLRHDSTALSRACTDLSEAARLEHALSPAAEWILDNSYLIHTQIAEVERHLPHDYSAWSSRGNGHRNLSGIAQELVAKSGYCITEASIRDCLSEYQTSHPLAIAELWAFPLFLRIALIEVLTGLALRVSEGQQLRESAYLWANRLAASARAGGADGTPEGTADDKSAFEKILHYLEAEPVARQPHFVTALAEQLQDEEMALGPAQHWIEDRFGESLIEVVRAQHTREAAETVSTSNAFGSLRTLGRLDYTKIFEDASLVEAELRKDPAGVYQQSDFATRDMSRRVVEKVSHYSGLEEVEVARQAIGLAWLEAETKPNDARTSHVLYYLLSDGLAQLEAEAKARIPLGKKLLRAACRHATPVYLAAITGLALSFVVLTWFLAWEAGVHREAFLIALTILALFPLSELSIQIVNALVISILPPDPLPKLDLRDGIPANSATLVAVPMMLTSAEVVRAELEKLEVRFLGNRNEHVYFSLVTDFTDASAENTPKDADLLQIARDGIADLNALYPLPKSPNGVEGDRFLLFHRKRTWSESEQSWIGRERKRGKLEELNAFLNGEANGILDTGRQPPPISYVITLDSDTQLPSEAARRLIETISHPLNRVEIDMAARVRRRGYTIIQPRVSITLPGATATRFTRIFADATGTDPYSRTVSDAQQDLFHEAMFHGKAIYDVRAFHTILHHRFPPETLLSHDLIEGAHVGVGLASDIELFEHLPVDYGSFAARQHRWLRGDWQIARWALHSVPASSGGSEPNPLSVINRWRILDNLRRSLVPVAALLLLCWDG